ncbi:hypothetical protein BOTNAR_0127g00240 [Botryotinia narcissicola]|uniref:Rhodopsin domain-containing protein n=1 Tax=Botryotinia narcissicola TaxID=278944 RepID=A0A4Z1IY92_9HELO|nr:hypothetical protein BOTNAR_0127g00240 [Botryotinia narcissicola]
MAKFYSQYCFGYYSHWPATEQTVQTGHVSNEKNNYYVYVLVTAISIIRLHALIEFANTTNVTWDYSPAAYWSTLEMHVGIFCGCLPALRPLLNMIMPKLQTTAAVSTQRTAGTTGKRSFMSSKASAPKRTEKNDFIPLDDVDASSTKFLTSSHCNAV